MPCFKARNVAKGLVHERPKKNTARIAVIVFLVTMGAAAENPVARDQA
jgi:hypothetical protein